MIQGLSGFRLWYGSLVFVNWFFSALVLCVLFIAASPTNPGDDSGCGGSSDGGSGTIIVQNYANFRVSVSSCFSRSLPVQAFGERSGHEMLAQTRAKWMRGSRKFGRTSSCSIWFKLYVLPARFQRTASQRSADGMSRMESVG